MLDIDLRSATDDELAFGMDQLQGMENLVHALRLLYVREFERRHASLQDGSESTADWLTYRHGKDPRTAREEVELANAVEDLPEILATYADGRISRDKLEQLATCVPPEDDAYWAQRPRCARSARSATGRASSAARSARR